MTWWWVLAEAVGEPLPPVDVEILVWADRFARWEQRWWVETEVHFQVPFRLLAERNHEARLDRVRIRAVLDCARTARLGSLEEVDCTVEDVALVGGTSLPGPADGVVLAEADAALVGARLQLQVDEAGRVRDVDVEGLTARNRRDRERIEGYRQLLSRVILPFHLALPEVVTPTMTWEEMGSRLLALPSDQGSGGFGRIVHTQVPYQGQLLVQSIGEATLRPTVGVDSYTLDADGVATTRGENVASYVLRMDGVAIVDPETGILTERVWALVGSPAAGTPDVLRARGYAHSGRFAMLGPGDTRDLGPTLALGPDAAWPAPTP